MKIIRTFWSSCGCQRTQGITQITSKGIRNFRADCNRMIVSNNSPTEENKILHIKIDEQIMYSLAAGESVEVTTEQKPTDKTIYNFEVEILQTETARQFDNSFDNSFA